MLLTVGTRSAALRSNRHICLSCQHIAAAGIFQANLSQQKRWIAITHIRRIKEAMNQWNERKAAIRAGQKQSMLSLLEERGYVNQIVGQREDLDNLLTERRCGAYVGVDPTAASLHIGHLVPFMALGWLMIHGYSATFMLGATTAKFGDPSSRNAPREPVATAVRKANMASMHQQLKKLGISMERYASRHGYAREWAWRREVANNSTWHSTSTLNELLRVMGTGTRIGPLLGRDTIQKRLKDGTGVSFADFTYPLVQAWDWWMLFKRGCQIQIGGADQFGNIMTGVEAIKAARKVEPFIFEETAVMRGDAGNKVNNPTTEELKENPSINDPIGFTVPLLTTSAGEKFGKSEGNAIWLDKQMTSSFDLYQFFLRCADADVERYLKLFTFVSTSEIATVMEEHRLDESKRHAQHLLASEFLELIYGAVAAKEAREQHLRLFDKNLSVDSVREAAASSDPSAGEQVNGKKADLAVPGDWNNSLNKYAKPTQREDAPSVHITLPRSLVVDKPFPSILWSAGLVSSKSEGHRLVTNKGCHVASQTGRDDTTEEIGDHLSFTPVVSTVPGCVQDCIIDGSLLILRIGKWKMKMIKLVDDDEYRESGLTCPGWLAEEGKEEVEGEEGGRGAAESPEQRRKAEAAKRLEYQAREKQFRTRMNERRHARLEVQKWQKAERRVYSMEGQARAKRERGEMDGQRRGSDTRR